MTDSHKSPTGRPTRVDPVSHLAWKMAARESCDPENSLGFRQKHADQAVRAFNESVTIGARVLYWPGTRYDIGRLSTTRMEAYRQGDSPMVMVHGYAGGISLTHIEPVGDTCPMCGK